MMKLGVPDDDIIFTRVQFKEKLFHALCGQSQDGCMDQRYIDSVPLELMPVFDPATIKTTIYGHVHGIRRHEEVAVAAALFLPKPPEPPSIRRDATFG